MKLHAIVFTDYSDIYSSSIYQRVLRDFSEAFRDDCDEDCKELPQFKPVAFYKKSVYWFEYRGECYIFMSSRLTQQELGRVEHCIFVLTGLRGIGNHIDSVEFIGRPNTPMKKFLMKRV